MSWPRSTPRRPPPHRRREPSWPLHASASRDRADLLVERGRLFEDRLDRDAEAAASYRDALAVARITSALCSRGCSWGHAGRRRRRFAVALEGLARRARRDPPGCPRDRAARACRAGAGLGARSYRPARDRARARRRDRASGHAARRARGAHGPDSPTEWRRVRWSRSRAGAAPIARRVRGSSVAGARAPAHPPGGAPEAALEALDERRASIRRTPWSPPAGSSSGRA